MTLMKNTSWQKFSLAFALIITLSATLHSQIYNPVKWSTAVEKTGEGEADLIIRATIEKNWHLYTQNPGDGPLPTEFSFTKSSDYQLSGKVRESKAIRKFEAMFDSEISYYEDKAEFRQKILIKNAAPFTVTVKVTGMSCDDSKCVQLDPSTLTFDIKNMGVSGAAGSKENLNDAGTGNTGCCSCDSIENIIARLTSGQALAPAANTDSSGEQHKDTAKTIGKAGTTGPPPPAGDMSEASVWSMFGEGFLGGLLALLTPCVYSMIPLTVSFFTKRSKDRKTGIRNALIYAASIISIFVVLGMLITIIFGGEALNEMASNIWVNLVFFAIFIIFAASFLGAFEITLPASWVNKMDSASDRGGLIGIFFMAFTLVLVSFSCTGPIIGNLLVLVGKGNYLGPTFGMFGFGLALSLPFALFAIFPGWLNSMPKSGGWLNSFKVVLGLIEIALALKFFSNADLIGGWHIVSREIFISVWAIVALMTGFYLLGKLKFAHDDDLPHISVTRTFLAIIFFTFGLYLIPGIWGAPVNLIGGFPPPETNEWSENIKFFKARSAASGTTTHVAGVHSESCPLDLSCFHDYDEALAYAKKVNKPLLLDFTGWTCVNCRKMEQNVWPQETVLPQLQNDYVVVSLYVDEKKELPKDKQYISARGTQVTTIGEKWKDLEISKYNQNAQPYYVLLDLNEQPLSSRVGMGYDIGKDVPTYAKFLSDGVAEFKKRSAAR